MANPGETYTVNQVAEILGISVRSVYRYVAACRPAFASLANGENNRLVFHADDLDALAKLVNLRKTTGIKLEALRDRFATPGQTCQVQAKPIDATIELAKPGNRETEPTLQNLADQVAELRAELVRVQAERLEDRVAMAVLLRRLTSLNRPALPSAPSSPPAPRQWRPLALTAPPSHPKPRTISWWQAFLHPELQRNS